MLSPFNETSISTPPSQPHSPSHSRESFSYQYRDHQQTPRRSRTSPFDVSPAPGLIRDGEEGYASLPTSPLDLTFPGVVHQAQHTPSGLPTPEPVSSLCGAFNEVPYPTSFDVNGLSGVAYGAHAQTDGLHSPTGHFGVVSNPLSRVLIALLNYFCDPKGY